ncbi:hypothetical protein IMG5_033670 [Ichthyophthirius multifiliis]|uniref:Uncharacterized protein n=1 Tax=Ichthyophthirius multifiliis TaxID=5932 RepID=G0QLM6_ICHMU|nr:hypothetical protein IMG5_033670 [Ichthyophthirius multifiliis]EGR33878.1 hypothetical protein IMG5_033670 [Ichthyophthirius multifiliis]|eukprot:XP_004039102.1 hypothetical protein IMG5_033670 [Ichthyophthirius multifiliis]
MRQQEADEREKFQAEKKLRLWQQIIAKISFAPPDEGFYKDQNYPVKPGYGLFKALGSARCGFKKLKVNIPETYLNFEQTQYLIYTDETGRVVRKPDTSWQTFTQKFKSQLDQEGFSKNRKFNDQMSLYDLYEKTNIKINQDAPIIILRGQASPDYLLSQNIFQVKTLGEKRSSSSDGGSNSFEQRYIYSRPMKATVLRLVFHTKNSQSTNANYAFRIQNLVEIFDPDTKISVNHKACISSVRQNTFVVQNVKGQGLKEYEQQAESLVIFLEKNNQIRIKQIVLDFMQDLEGKIWLISMKSILAENTISMEQIIAKKANKQKTLDQLTCSVYCKLCGIIFKKDDVSKVLTYKLLWELVQHLKKRNLPLKNIKVSHSSTRPCRVCNLCYMLVVGEHELIEIEQKFARAQNIPLYDAVIRVPIDKKPKHRPALLSEKLCQWRLIFYISEISNIGIDQNIDFKNLYFQYKLHNFRTSFKIQVGDQVNNDTQKKNRLYSGDSKLSGQTQQRKNSTLKNNQLDDLGFHNQQIKHYSQLNLNHIRVHYFFSEDLNIDKFLKETQIKVRLCQGPDWNAFLAEGTSKTISHFKNKDKSGQRHSSQVLLFFENAKYCVLKINTGLVYDGEYNTGKLNLQKYNDVYFPDENFYNCNPFPDEWMEMFDPSYVTRKNEMEDQEGTEKYSPKCTKAELNKMIDFNSYKNNSKFKLVESRVQQMIRIKSAATTLQSNPNNYKNNQEIRKSNELQANFINNQENENRNKSKDKQQRAKTAKIIQDLTGSQKNLSKQIKRPVTSVSRTIKNQDQHNNNQNIMDNNNKNNNNNNDNQNDSDNQNDNENQNNNDNNNINYDIKKNNENENNINNNNKKNNENDNYNNSNDDNNKNKNDNDKNNKKNINESNNNNKDKSKSNNEIYNNNNNKNYNNNDIWFPF